MNLDLIFLDIKHEVQDKGGLRKLFEKDATGEEDTIPLFKFTQIISNILNRGTQTFPEEIDKFARIFMVTNSKSMISFAELER